MVTLLFLIPALTLFTITSADCAKLKPMKKFDISKLEGVWYEWASLRPYSLFAIHTCHTLKFYIGSDRKSATAVSYMQAYQDGGQARIRSNWYISDPDPALDGKLVAKLKPLIFDYANYPLIVVDTDYENYLVFYICKEMHPFDLTVGYILTRKNSYNTGEIDVIDKNIKATLTKLHIHREDFTAANQENCPPVNFPATVDVSPSLDPSSRR